MEHNAYAYLTKISLYRDQHSCNINSLSVRLPHFPQQPNREIPCKLKEHLTIQITQMCVCEREGERREIDLTYEVNNESLCSGGFSRKTSTTFPGDRSAYLLRKMICFESCSLIFVEDYCP